ncbi:MAG: NADH-quinone oxidoreductase subunit C [Eubacteriales bacterium]|nr:NADH-quinone oxidoreductase subunit C [Eubacteriales bacterium]MDD3199300.1 NADH-quinone oxidoreductase subunit C [Eubacteriales bacterium]MDD4121299.1 NADH-quinone oxidoreductase subunit C [Eubacteriales bacterium]MDD4629430.1 NADH-quinone oxidoreductase subunit C [Eubacteriales bacterium]
MTEKWRIQNFIVIEPAQLIEKVQDLKADGYRLGQIHCTKISEGFELTYSLDKDHILTNLRLIIPEEKEIMSVTGIYWPAFIFENEMQDLFGVKFKHMALNYGGRFFKVSQQTPWNPKETEGKAE